VACSRIHKGKGICGTAWEKAKSIMVPDVSQFPGHIACSALSQSELVLPVIIEGKVWGVLDIDSAFLNDFDQDDVEGMGVLLNIITKHIS
jgi:GAF domain-containing protein